MDTDYSHDTTADPSRLWALLSDVEAWGSWNHGIQTITLDGPLTVGATIRMTPPGEDTIVSTIVALDPPRLISDHTSFEGTSIRVDHRLEQIPGGTKILYTITVTGDVPADIAEQIGSAVSADFPDVIRTLAEMAG